ncbi:hypothetical protein PHYSODRAFT_296564 [Phytophthora sojae]|uniref:Uncharacterized protein n=1 Tax=Phytophthora sojae (strain P6497) TaxID=1094619 RepID=G4YXM0_PHYSP|nr:hypothetical protein PHYSODRAFT_296564 [Phytophthora sojae]EGZ24509.1 hypothetical protein PHYSODRAFT_296564 [Phytophthora sojae]|eukprot:XP_009519797.1 hypothetical protein PHYSODRAFT_296564 [Phytophthora sojae]
MNFKTCFSVALATVMATTAAADFQYCTDPVCGPVNSANTASRKVVMTAVPSLGAAVAVALWAAVASRYSAFRIFGKKDTNNRVASASVQEHPVAMMDLLTGVRVVCREDLRVQALGHVVTMTDDFADKSIHWTLPKAVKARGFRARSESHSQSKRRGQAETVRACLGYAACGNILGNRGTRSQHLSQLLQSSLEEGHVMINGNGN